jgi:hypothetical protein
VQPAKSADIRLHSILEYLESWSAERSWVGPDPYEGLNSPLGRVAPGRIGRQAVTQAYKRLPFPPPWPLRCAPRPNAKALALALSGYATTEGRRLRGAAEQLDTLPRRLEELSLLDNGAAWGYPFPVQTRGIRYGPWTPNAIATCFAVGGLCDAAAATADERPARLALATRPFLLSLRRDSKHGPYFGYVAEGSALIHNANLLVCGALARLHAIEPDAGAEAAVTAAAGTTRRLQRDDGLWPYGEVPGHDWVDNFHTAYVLDGLHRVEGTFGVGGETLARGLEAWRSAFIESDGWARYYQDRRFPLETHCCASAIDLLCLRAEDDAGSVELARRVAACAVRELWLEDERRFAFRRTRLGLNKREFMRWTNAPMFKALAALASAQ